MPNIGWTPDAGEAMNRGHGDRRLRIPRTVLGVAVLVALAAAGWRVQQQSAWPDRFAPAAAWPAQDAAAGRAPEPGAGPQARFVSRQPGAAVHAATLVALRDGRLRAAWFSGSREGAADVEIRTSVFDPSSGVWSAEQTALTRAGTALGLARYIKKLGNPVLARAPDGRLHLYVVTVSLGGWAGSSITRFESPDEGETWQWPHRLVTSPFLNLGTLVKGKPIAYADGSLGLPVYHELVTKYPEWLRLGPAGQVLDRIRLPHSERSLQPVLLSADTTRAELLMRHAAEGTLPRITHSATNDAGRSWSPVQPIDLPNPNAAVVGLVTARGDRLLVFNDSETNRGNLTLAIARPADPGKPTIWQRLALLDGRSQRAEDASAPAAAYRQRVTDDARALGAGDAAAGVDPAVIADAAARQLCYPDANTPPSGERCNYEFSYPSLVELAPGDFHLAYTWHRTRIKHLRFSQAWVDAQRAVIGDAAPGVSR